MQLLRKSVVLLFFFCVTLTASAQWQQEEIKVAAGPEDMTLDKNNGNPRLILSCGDFKNSGNNQRKGGIYSYDLATGEVVKFIINDLPHGLQLFPHGLFLLSGSPSTLYIINHDQNNNQENHAVILFEMTGNELKYKTAIKARRYLTSPNDLTVLPDGSFYVTNTGSFKILSLLFRFVNRSSFVSYYDIHQSAFRKVYHRIGVANGIANVDDRVYVANSMGKSLHVLTRNANGSLERNRRIKVAKHPDNISINEKTNKLIIASHDSTIKLNASQKDRKHLSPFRVSTVNLKDDSVSELLSHNGSQIGGVSTALIHNDELYLSQIFYDYILKVKWQNPN
jgi:DNA-binding beta-propeller fold protein YncE